MPADTVTASVDLDVTAEPRTFDLAVERLARAARVDVSRAEIERVRSRAGPSPRGEHAWSAELARIGAELGVRVRAVDVSADELAAGLADDVLPLVRPGARRRDGVGASCVTVLERSGRRLRVALDDAPETTVLDASALASLLGVGSDAAVRWATGDPIASLASSHASPLERLVSLVKAERDDVMVVVVYAAGVGLLSLATPLGVQFLVNTVAFGALLQPVFVLSLLVLAGLALEGLLLALRSWVIERIQQRIFVRVALDAAFRLPRARQDALEDRAARAPELVHRFFDVVTLQKGAAALLSDGVSVALSALVGMAVLAFYHPFLLAFDVALVAGVALVVFVLGRRGVETSIDESAAKYAVAAWLGEAATHRTALALGGGPAYVAARAEALTRGWLDRRRRHFGIVFRQLASGLVLRAVASAALLGLGGWLVFARQLSLGQLVAAELVVSAVVAGFAKLGKTFEDFYDLAAAADKVGHLVDVEVIPGDGAPIARDGRGLSSRASGLDVVSGDRALVRGVDLDLGPGSRTVILDRGESAGASALVDVLVGLRPAARGRLLVDGLSADELSVAPLRASVAVVRGPEVFEGTLFDNVAAGLPGVDRRAARTALEAVGLSELLDALPGGLDAQLPGAPLGARAELLVTIARALVGSARMLVLDGALDRLDDARRRAVWRAVSGRPWTVLVTTARRDLLGLGEAAYELEGTQLAAASGTLHLARPAGDAQLRAEEA